MKACARQRIAHSIDVEAVLFAEQHEIRSCLWGYYLGHSAGLQRGQRQSRSIHILYVEAGGSIRQGEESAIGLRQQQGIEGTDIVESTAQGGGGKSQPRIGMDGQPNVRHLLGRKPILRSEEHTSELQSP